MAAKEEKVIERLIKFAEWCVGNDLYKSKSEFERVCGLSKNYLYNTLVNSKSSVGSDVLLKVHRKFKFLNISWLVVGEGSMVNDAPEDKYDEYENLLAKYEKIKLLMGEMNDVISK